MQAHPSSGCRVGAGLQTHIPPSPPASPAHGAGHPWLLTIPQQFNKERWGKERK